MKRSVAFLVLSLILLIGVLLWRMGPPPEGLAVELDVRPGPAPAVIVLGGSEGGAFQADHPLIGALRNAGFQVARVAYFGAPGTPAKLDRIALDPLDGYIAVLAADPRVMAQCLYVVGASKGAELALLLGAGNAAVRGVAAVAPSHVVFQSSRLTPFATSSWRRGDRSLAFVPYPRDLSTLRGVLGGDRFLEMHKRALENEAAVARATIPVERINGPVLLVGAAGDGVWPSAAMARSVAGRLAASEFPHRVDLTILPGDHYLLERAPAREAVVTFLTASAQQAGCLPRIAR